MRLASVMTAAFALLVFSSSADANGRDAPKTTCKDCKPATVQNEKVNVPAPAPQRVKVKQQIIVETVPEFIYAPMEVRVQQPRPVVHRTHKWHADAPPPPRVVIGAPCPPPQVTMCRTPRCVPRQVSACGARPCPTPVYGAAYPARSQRIVTASAPGTVGGGYVQGAPTSPEECAQRGGTDLGQGCKNYR